MMNNVYQLTSISASEIFTLPQKFIDFLDLFSLPFKSIHNQEIKMLGEEAFYRKMSQLASYQIYIGILVLEQIPGRKQVFDYYNEKREHFATKRGSLLTTKGCA